MIKKITSVVAIVLVAGTSLLAQDKPVEKKDWTYKAVTGLNLAQTSLTNWAAGGENSVAWNVYFNGSANYKKSVWSWDNSLVADFGQTYTESNDWQKSLDKLNLTSKLGRAIAPKMNLSVLGDFLTQFANGYTNAKAQQAGEEPISTFMAPGYLSLSIGVDYKPNDNLSLLFSPLSGKMTFVLDERLSDLGAFGVEKGEKVFAELGTSFVANYSKEIFKNVSLQTKLTLFTAYTHDFGNIDVNWDVMLAAKINKYMSATFTTNLIYDDDIEIANDKGVLAPRVQFRQVLGIGVSYNF